MYSTYFCTAFSEKLYRKPLCCLTEQLFGANLHCVPVSNLLSCRLLLQQYRQTFYSLLFFPRPIDGPGKHQTFQRVAGFSSSYFSIEFSNNGEFKQIIVICSIQIN